MSIRPTSRRVSQQLFRASCAKDVHRLLPLDFLPIWRRTRLINEPFERKSVGVDDPGRVGNDEEGKAVLGYARVT